ncbi:FAD-dependent monooxygenase [Nocardia sp. CA-119907]|uniref:FAD-dependent monooxygenase n=1 Tax=Nocardia sp. CA-119907 TaxID=3239973 RepID=UPI003D96F556
MRVPFLIIGGGIGGMTTALALAQAGFAVHIVEQAPEFGEIGAGIQLAPNAIRILDQLGLAAAIERIAVRPKNLVFLDIDSGEQLATVDLADRFVARYGQSYSVLHRGDLLDALLDACRAQANITLETNKTVTGIANRENNTVVVDFADSTQYVCDAVVGADGLWSKTRALLSDDAPICSAYVAYRGALPMSEVSAPVENDDEIVWIGPNKHLVQYPIRGGDLYNQVAVFRSDHFDPAIAGTEEWGTPDELDEHFGTACGQVRGSISQFKREKRWPMYDRAPLANWTVGRVTLLGDAAHPMLQYLAQGACQAIEDAECLTRFMAEHSGDVDEAFAAYQAERIPRTAQIQSIARMWGEIWHTEDPIVRELRNRVFARDTTEHYVDLDWLYQVRVG